MARTVSSQALPPQDASTGSDTLSSRVGSRHASGSTQPPTVKLRTSPPGTTASSTTSERLAQQNLELELEQIPDTNHIRFVIQVEQARRRDENAIMPHIQTAEDELPSPDSQWLASRTAVTIADIQAQYASPEPSTMNPMQRFATPGTEAEPWSPYSIAFRTNPELGYGDMSNLVRRYETAIANEHGVSTNVAFRRSQNQNPVCRVFRAPRRLVLQLDGPRRQQR